MEVRVHWLLEAEGAEAVDLDVLEKAIRRAVESESLEGPVDLSVTLTGDEEIRRLNATYRDTDEVTDVLSFPQMENAGDFVVPPDGVLHLGDIVISLPQAQRQAAEYGHSGLQELAQLAVHGALHLLGYDHADEAEAQAMQAKERAALKKA